MSLAIEAVSAGYSKDPVLRDINVRIKEGCICALMGRNGSGKTTLLRCINAILRPRTGKVTAFGSEITKLSRVEIAHLISLVPQSSFTAFPFSCLEMILMGCSARIKPWSSPGRKDVHKAMALMEEMDIHALAHRPFNQLSGGERQLVMLSRALFQEAPIMLMDEPNAHLDFANQHKMMAMIREVVRKRGVTALISVHDPNLALYYCDRAVLLKEGSVAAQGPMHEVMKDSILQHVLGHNIHIDTTRNGLPVVTPLGIIPTEVNHDTEAVSCAATIANGAAN